MDKVKEADKGVAPGLSVHFYHWTCTLCPRKKQSQRIFSIILIRTDGILKNLEDLFLSLLRTQLQLHFQRSLC